MIDENLKEEFKKLKIKGIEENNNEENNNEENNNEENNNADFENYKKRLKIKNANKTLELLHIKMKHKKGDIFNIRKLVT
ncbi:MAG: hypothetical protein ACKA34_00545 [Candidatus Karelsulcia muelleri]